MTEPEESESTETDFDAAAAQQRQLESLGLSEAAEPGDEGNEVDRPLVPEGQPPIPDGWTYLAHGTAQVSWKGVDLSQTPEVVMTRPLSAVSREMIERDRKFLPDSPGATTSYAAHRPRPAGMSDEEFKALSIPLELRILFYPEEASTRMVSQRWQTLPPETRALAAKYYYANLQAGRHAVVPRGERLHLLSQDAAEDGHPIYYYVPESVRTDYENALESEEHTRSQEGESN